MLSFILTPVSSREKYFVKLIIIDIEKGILKSLVFPEICKKNPPSTCCLVSP
jgi:hypothetical protein